MIISSLKLRERMWLLVIAPILCNCSAPKHVRGPIFEGDEESRSSIEAIDYDIDCGNLVSRNSLNRFSLLIHSITQATEGEFLTDGRLYAEGVTYTRSGKVLRTNRYMIAKLNTPAVSRQDWLLIASEIQKGNVRSGGWRGCFVADGKAALMADSAGRIGLSSFDFDRAWNLR